MPSAQIQTALKRRRSYNRYSHSATRRRNMNSFEKTEIEKLDSKYRPIGAWGYFGYNILFSLPVVGFICLLVFCFSDSNINRRSYARSFFCATLLALIVIGIIVGIMIASGTFAAVIEQIKNAMQQQQPQG